MNSEVKVQNPTRWRGRASRNWTPVETVWLNPDREPTVVEPARRAAEWSGTH